MARPLSAGVTDAQLRAAAEWVCANSGVSFSGSFQETLKNGVYLAKVAYKIDKSSIKERFTTPQKKALTGAFGQNEARERLGQVIIAFRTIGVPERYLFDRLVRGEELEDSLRLHLSCEQRVREEGHRDGRQADPHSRN
jgi:hypothetical protein